MIKLYNQDNMLFDLKKETGFNTVDLVYADMIYEDKNIEGWISKYWNLLKENGIFQIQTDYHTSAQVKLFLDSLPNSKFVNEVIYKQEWGGVPKKGFAQKHDNIFIYCKGNNFYWNDKEILIEKKTKGTSFDKKGTGMKKPCSVWDDLGNFSTMSKERIKLNKKNIKWQKPIKLMHRLFSPFTKENDLILDIYMGSGSAGEWCGENNRHYIGIEYDAIPYNLSVNRLSKYFNDKEYIPF